MQLMGYGWCTAITVATVLIAGVLWLRRRTWLPDVSVPEAHAFKKVPSSAKSALK